MADEIKVHEEESDSQDSEHLLSLFRLDLRSDRDTLKDADMDRVRQLYREAVGSAPMHAEEQTCFRLFLRADEEEVFAGVARSEFQIKCVQVDYEAADYVPKNTRMGGQRYFGWMKMTTRSFLELWHCCRSRNCRQLRPLRLAGCIRRFGMGIEPRLRVNR